MASERFREALAAGREDRVRVIRILEYIGPRSWVESTVARSVTEMHGAGVVPWSIKAATLGTFPEILERGVVLGETLTPDEDPRPLATEEEIMAVPPAEEPAALTSEIDTYRRTGIYGAYTVNPNVVVNRNGQDFKVGDRVRLGTWEAMVLGFLLDYKGVQEQYPILLSDWYAIPETRVYIEHQLVKLEPEGGDAPAE